MPYQPIEDNEEYHFGPLGNEYYDDQSNYGDPYWCSMSDSGRFFAIYEFTNNFIHVFEAKDQTWVEIDTISTTADQKAGTADWYPGEEKFLYNTGTAAAEYDAETQTSTTLFTLPDGSNPGRVGLTYHGPNRDNIQAGKVQTTNCRIFDRSGNVVQSQTVGFNQHFGTIWWNTQDGRILTTKSGGVGLYDSSDGSLIAEIDNWDMPAHICQKGPYVSVGNEKDNALVFGAAGTQYNTYPERSNLVYFRDPPGRVGFDYVGAYYFSPIRFSEDGLRRGPNSRFTVWNSGTISSGGGFLNRKVMLGHNQKARVHIENAAGGDPDITHHIFRFKPFILAGAYTSVFRDSQNTSFWQVEQESGTAQSVWEIRGVPAFTASIENNTGSNVDGEIWVEKTRL